MGDRPDGVHERARAGERADSQGGSGDGVPDRLAAGAEGVDDVEGVEARSPLAAFTTWLVLVVAFFVAGAVVRSVRAGSLDVGAMVVPTLIAAVVLGAWMVFRYRREA